MIRLQRVLFAIAAAASAVPANAQTFDTVGTRAAGMGGAFVAVADDASASYWNPAGFATGNYFTMVVDRTTGRTDPNALAGASGRSGLLVALGMPALGLSYYRLRSTSLQPAGLPTAAAVQGRKAIGADELRLDTLITHHSGATVVQSLAPGLAVGATLKLVRGVASSSLVADVDRGALLDRATELAGRGSSKFDADLGVMATAGRLKAGLTVRNATQPSFALDDGSEGLTLQRQARAGIAVSPREGWAVAADVDLNRTRTALGEVRELAAGTEGRIARKAFIRGGVRLNTAGPRGPTVAAGGSYAVHGSVLVDAYVSGGSDRAHRGWGVAARFVY